MRDADPNPDPNPNPNPNPDPSPSPNPSPSPSPSPGLLLDVDQAACSTPPLPAKLKNRYFALRHGQSESNLEGVISSAPAVGTVKHGLTAEGRLQARQSATKLLDLVGRENLGSLAFVSSDFTRAWQTAEEALSAVSRIVAFEQQACEYDATSRPGPGFDEARQQESSRP